MGLTSGRRILHEIRRPFHWYTWSAHHHINIVITHIAGFNNNIADYLSHFQNQRFQNWHHKLNQHWTASLHGQPILYSAFQQIICHSIAPSTLHTYRSEVTTFQNFCTRYAIIPYPASTTTLQFF